MVVVVRGEPDGNTEIITNVFGMPHAKFDCFEICVFVMSYLVTIYQSVTCITENKLIICSQQLMSVY